MEKKHFRDFHYLFFLLLLPLCNSLPMCNNLGAPIRLDGHLGFCRYSGNACCSSSEDLHLERQFQAMNISDSTCALAVKSVLCARCDPFAAQLFNADSNLRPLPFLCNSTIGDSNSSRSFCSEVWSSCRNALILNSPFAPALQTRAGVSQNSTLSRLSDFWQSESDFCIAFGTTTEANSTCFNGGPVSLNLTNTVSPPKGLCVEKIGNGSYINLIPHPDGSNRGFFTTLSGKIFLADIPDQDSGVVLDESNLFLDLSDQVHLDTTFGMTGLAFHPNFVRNGRFFVSFNCDRNTNPNCRGRCACNSDVNCDPSELFTEGEQPCRYHSVIAEYSVNGSSPNLASPREVRRIFTLGLPFTANHGGQILFGPDDGYLYFMMGDGGGRGDPYNFAQNRRSVLGKIMRIDVDNIPSQAELVSLGRWGNYSVPSDNPYADSNQMQPEIWAYGLRNPWRCSFDSDRPSYFFCGDIGQDLYEEVDLIYKGGNYGWSTYEGPLISRPQNTSVRHTSARSIDPIVPILQYSHSSANKLGSAAVVGGYLYRSQSDPCAYGSYLYADLYASHIWAAQETPSGSGNFTTTDISLSCASDSPIKCDLVINSTIPAFQLIFSFGEDNRKDVFFLSQSGVYRIVRPSRCSYSCSKEVLISSSRPPTAQPSSAYNKPLHLLSLLTALSFFLLLLY